MTEPPFSAGARVRLQAVYEDPACAEGHSRWIERHGPVLGRIRGQIGVVAGCSFAPKSGWSCRVDYSHGREAVVAVWLEIVPDEGGHG